MPTSLQEVLEGPVQVVACRIISQSLDGRSIAASGHVLCSVVSDYAVVLKTGCRETVSSAVAVPPRPLALAVALNRRLAVRPHEKSVCIEVGTVPLFVPRLLTHMSGAVVPYLNVAGGSRTYTTFRRQTGVVASGPHYRAALAKL